MRPSKTQALAANPAEDSTGVSGTDKAPPERARRRTDRVDRDERKAAAMNPSRLFIERPVATTLLMFAILMVGVAAYRFLPLSALPQVDYPTIQVQTFYPG